MLRRRNRTDSTWIKPQVVREVFNRKIDFGSQNKEG